MGTKYSRKKYNEIGEPVNGLIKVYKHDKIKMHHGSGKKFDLNKRWMQTGQYDAPPPKMVEHGVIWWIKQR